MEEVFNIIDVAVAFAVGGFMVGVLQRIHLNNRLAGITPVAEVEEVQPRRARRLEVDTVNPGPCVLAECNDMRGADSGLCLRHDAAYSLRHRVPNQPGDEDELGTDTTVDVPVEEPTARRRFTGIAMPHATLADQVRDAADPVGAIARRRTRLHMSTEASNRNARVILAQLDEGMDMQHAIYGDSLERPLLYEEIASEYPTAYYAIVTRPDQPQKPGDNQKPKLRKHKQKHAHGGTR
jgi:hypothetical protein